MELNELIAKKQLGGFAPSEFLSNVAISYFEEPQFATRRLFPICPVQLPSGYFYEFSRADLARDGVRRKPDYGKVAPTVLGHSEKSYSCHVDQILIGIDKLLALAYQRAAGSQDENELKRIRTRALTEQIANHIELEFSQRFFKQGVWQNEWVGAATADSANKKFVKFDSAKANPLQTLDDMMMEVKASARIKPNKLALGVKAFNALKNNPEVLSRIKFTGTADNPAIVTENVLAQIFGLESVVVLDATYNAAPVGGEDIKFVCDPKSALLLYSPKAPAIDLPSAGYCFTWLLDEADYITIQLIEGDEAAHADFLEGLIAYDLQLTSQALGLFMSEVCA